MFVNTGSFLFDLFIDLGIALAVSNAYAELFLRLAPTKWKISIKKYFLRYGNNYKHEWISIQQWQEYILTWL